LRFPSKKQIALLSKSRPVSITSALPAQVKRTVLSIQLHMHTLKVEAAARSHVNFTVHAHSTWLLHKHRQSRCNGNRQFLPLFLIERDIGIYGMAVLAYFSYGISAFSLKNCGITILEILWYTVFAILDSKIAVIDKICLRYYSIEYRPMPPSLHMSMKSYCWQMLT
jgi:hypothetical protein